MPTVDGVDIPTMSEFRALERRVAALEGAPNMQSGTLRLRRVTKGSVTFPRAFKKPPAITLSVQCQYPEHNPAHFFPYSARVLSKTNEGFEFQTDPPTFPNVSNPEEVLMVLSWVAGDQ